MNRNRSAGAAVYWDGKTQGQLLSGGNDGDEEENRGTRDRHRDDCAVHAARNDRRAPGADLGESMPARRPLFGPATLTVSGAKSALLQLIERAQLEILYRHPR